MHLGAHISNLFFVESVRGFYRTYFPILSGWEVRVEDGRLAVPDDPGLGAELTASALTRDDLTTMISEDAGLSRGRRAMGDRWAVEEIR